MLIRAEFIIINSFVTAIAKVKINGEKNKGQGIPLQVDSYNLRNTST